MPPNIVDNPEPLTFISDKFSDTQYNYAALVRELLPHTCLSKHLVTTYKILHGQYYITVKTKKFLKGKTEKN